MDNEYNPQLDKIDSSLLLIAMLQVITLAGQAENSVRAATVLSAMVILVHAVSAYFAYAKYYKLQASLSEVKAREDSSNLERLQEK